VLLLPSRQLARHRVGVHPRWTARSAAGEPGLFAAARL